jgi:hypothetical protein
MKKAVLILLIIKASVSIAQSKKEQIESLKLRIDSLNEIIYNDRNTYSQEASKFNSKTLNQETKIGYLDSLLNNTKYSLIQKEKELSNLRDKFNILNNDFLLLKTRLDSLTGFSESLNKNRNNKEDEALKAPLTLSKVTCTEKETPNKYGGEPIITKTCLFKKYKIISKGTPDYKGRYSYEYSVFKKQENGNYTQVKTNSLFNKNKSELLSIVNDEIEKEFYAYYNNPEIKHCFEGISFTPFNFDQIGISFNSNKIDFHVTFGLCLACMAVDGTVVSFDLDEMQKYIEE